MRKIKALGFFAVCIALVLSLSSCSILDGRHKDPENPKIQFENIASIPTEFIVGTAPGTGGFTAITTAVSVESGSTSASVSFPRGTYHIWFNISPAPYGYYYRTRDLFTFEDNKSYGFSLDYTDLDGEDDDYFSYLGPYEL